MPRRYSLGKRETAVVETRKAIVDALLRLMGARDYNSITLKEIAREADVAEKTVQRHFGSKHGIFLAWAESAVEVEGARLLQMSDGHCPHCAAQRLVRGLFGVYEENAARMWAFLGASSGSQEIAAFSEEFIRFRRRLARSLVDDWPEVWRLPGERTAQMLLTATSFLLWKALREQSGLTAEEAVSATMEGIDKMLMKAGVGAVEAERVPLS